MRSPQQANRYELYIDWQLVYTAHAWSPSVDRERRLLSEIKEMFAQRIKDCTQYRIYKTEKIRIE
jgi:hypothetical protein